MSSVRAVRFMKTQIQRCYLLRCSDVLQVSAAPTMPSSGSSQLRGRMRDGGSDGGSSSSSGRIYQASPTREEAPASPSTNKSPNKRAKRPMIGPAVWAAFKDEQKVRVSVELADVLAGSCIVFCFLECIQQQCSMQ